MRSLLPAVFLTIFLAGCGENDCSSASCIAPPEGTFQSDRYNIAIGQTVFDGTEFFELDSVIIAANRDILIKSFNTWVVIEEPTEVTSFALYSGENQYSVNEELPEISGNVKGYLIGFTKDGGSILLHGEIASEDLINGVCNDTIDC